MSKLDAVRQIEVVLSELHALLQSEGRHHKFGHLFRRSFELARAADTYSEAIEALKEFLIDTPNVPGSIHDLVIWRDSFEERKAINERLESLRDKLFSLAESL